MKSSASAACWAQKLRRRRGQAEQSQPRRLQEAKIIYLAGAERDAIRRYRHWKSHWETLEPKAVAPCLQQDIQALLTFFAVPVADRRQVCTTNAIERAFREVRRRTKPMSCFNNPSSIDRIVFAVFSHLNNQWEKLSK